jgi:multiple sugar transport system ATP-binding protein
MSFLELNDLRKVYPDGTEAVKGIHLTVKEGEFIVLLGPSGCGKTTTLRMIAGLELPSAGQIRLAEQDVTWLRPSQRDVGFVFQFYALYPHLNVRENIEFPLRCIGMSNADIAERMEAVVRRMGLEDLLARRPRQLSGGDQQRVSLARAMVRRPRIYLMDEPLGTLDSDQRLEMREFIRAQQLEQQVTTLYVTHDQEEAMSLADRIVVMEGGKICQVGTPGEVYDRPANLFVANFVGSPGMNFIRGRVEGGSFLTTKKGLALAKSEHPARTLGIRSEFVRADANGPISGVVAMDEYLGSHRNIHVDTEDGKVVMRSSERYRVGESIRLSFDADHIRLFNDELS